MFPICRIGRLVFTPVTSPFAECSAAFGWKRRVHPTQYSRLFLTDWLSSGRVTLNDPSSRASFRNPRDLWLADRFNGDSFPLSSTLFGQLFHRQLLLLTATPIAIKLLGESLTPTSELRCPLLRIVSKGKCLSHPHCRVPCTDEGSMQACPPVSWLGRAGTCTPYEPRLGVFLRAACFERGIDLALLLMLTACLSSHRNKCSTLTSIPEAGLVVKGPALHPSPKKERRSYPHASTQGFYAADVITDQDTSFDSSSNVSKVRLVPAELPVASTGAGMSSVVFCDLDNLREFLGFEMPVVMVWL